ncbi:MmgE/PrpD family protein [Chelatococcus asaccharovorans]|uniref:MmgE/PrpD family protein n=1 Tax=Chelatococcus asaccharovorans TaxID=28210 RepID=UPI0011B6EE46|nr:MmgE/PrpD family protein [Chelatococcus asaccharovorans]MBS7703735.1 MmgE/PrpD family protein [Chelatococcus asaccharovorans]
MKAGSTVTEEARSGFTNRLAAMVAETPVGAFSDAALAAAARAILNFVGTAIGGSTQPSQAILSEAIGVGAESGPSTVLGTRIRTNPLSASYLNAASANVLDFDDTHLPTVAHPIGPVASALLALSQQRPTSGTVLLQSLILGVEVACRLGRSLTPAHYARGWHITATTGVVGAAAGAARAMGLPLEHTSVAMAHAATQACGLVVSLGAMSKSLAVAGAARNGLLSAILAERGFTAPANAIEAPFGFVDLFGANASVDLPRRIDRPGWELESVQLKPYPCAVVINPLVECGRAVAEAVGSDEIATIAAHGPPLLLIRANRPNISSRGEAQLSAQHALAATLLHGQPRLEDFGEAAISDLRLADLRARIGLVADLAHSIDSARLAVTLHNGRVLEWEVGKNVAIGQRMLSPQDLEAKFVTLAVPVIGEERAARIMSDIAGFGAAVDIGAVMEKWNFMEKWN